MQMRQSRSRLMALLLAGLMLFSSLAVLAGCADSEGDATATETGSGVQSGSSAEEETKAARTRIWKRRSTTGNSLSWVAAT